MNVIQAIKNRTKLHYILYIVAILSIFLSFSSDSAFAKNVDYSVTIAPALTLTTTTNSLVLNLDPSSKTFESKTLTVSAGTNNKTGYTLTLSTPNDNTDLDRDNSVDSISATIPTLASGTYTESTFTPDRWGYKINSNTSIPSTITTDYIPFVSGNTLMESSIAINHDETELAFAAKIDYLQPAGAYNTTLQFSMVANPLVDYMQNMDSSICVTDAPITVVDKRDDEEYLIQRLADGNCWMLDNLRLDPTTVPLTMLKGNTNATDESLTYLKNGGGTAPYAASGATTTWASSNSSSTIPYVYTATKDNTASIRVSSDNGSDKVGVYYTVCASSAGSYCYERGSYVGNVEQDICPSGWRLPTSGSSGEYQKLYAAYSSNATNFRTALSVPLTGWVANGTVYRLGLSSPMRSSTRSNSTTIYKFYDLEGTIYTYYSDLSPQAYGEAVRCILK